MKNTLLLFSILLFQAFGLKAQVLNKPKLDSLFSILEEHNKIMGHLSIFQNGKEVYSYSTGFANVDKKIPIIGNTKYRIGSVSKMITATVIMQLIEEGQLSYNTKLSQFYPDIPNASEINILYLLQHKSGLQNIIQDQTYKDWRKNALTRQEMLSKIKELGSNFNAGEKQEYSNTNYVLLTFIAEDIDKKPFSKIIARRISKPLRLKNTFYGSPIKEENKEAIPYHKKEKWIPAEETSHSVALGAGAIVSTPGDLNVFTTALFNGKFLNDSSLKLMQEIQKEYGIGLKRMDVQGMELLGHSGGIDGFKSISFYAPSNNMSFSYSSNGSEISLSELLWAVSSIATSKAYDLPNFNSRKIHTPRDLENIVGTYKDRTSKQKLTVLSQDDTILIQEGPQSKGIELDAIKMNRFRMGLAGATFDFHPEAKTLTVNFDGEKMNFIKI
ncbi:serine hydrolase domain-containing protein [Pontibacter populi]|uniref:Serine hydrolase domain-containing protein n=1 Tax=Pontibacter populi TaxID=890055 RepID=A0ABV1RX66_9BACT